MKPSKPILINLPDLLVNELNECLVSNPPVFKYRIEYFFYLVQHLTRNQLANKDKDFVSINTKNSRYLITWNIEIYIQYLKIYDFINTDNMYKVGEKSTGYRLNPKFIKGSVQIEIKPGTSLFKKIIKDEKRKKSNYSKMPEYLQTMNKAFMKLDFDYKGAEAWINNFVDVKGETEVKKFYYRASMTQIQDKRFRYFHRNKTNKRLDTNLTNLKSDLRNFITGDFVSIDLKNSQPFFLSQILAFFSTKNFISTINNKPITDKPTPHSTIWCGNGCCDMVQSFGVSVLQRVGKSRKKHDFNNFTTLSLFEKSVFEGVFYDDFKGKFSGEITRKEVKNMMFKVLFSQNVIYDNYQRFEPYKKEKEIFASVYPDVYETIRILKEKDHTKLAVFLQRLESYIFIDVIAQRLVSKGIIPLTVHDSVIIKREFFDKTLKIIKDVFRESFGIAPAFNIENVGAKAKIKQSVNV